MWLNHTNFFLITKIPLLLQLTLIVTLIYDTFIHSVHYMSVSKETNYINIRQGQHDT